MVSFRSSLFEQNDRLGYWPVFTVGNIDTQSTQGSATFLMPREPE